jgi:hypothetical protein
MTISAPCQVSQKKTPSSPEPLQILNPYSCLLLFRSSLCSGSLTWAPRPRSFVKKCSVSGPCFLVGVAGAAGGSAASMPSRGAPSLASTSICMLACEESDGEVGSVPQHVDFKTSTVQSFAEVVKFGCIPSSPRRPSSSSPLPPAEHRRPQVRLFSASDPFDLGPPFHLWPKRVRFDPRSKSVFFHASLPRLVWALLVVCWADLQLV